MCQLTSNRKKPGQAILSHCIFLKASENISMSINREAQEFIETSKEDLMHIIREENQSKEYMPSLHPYVLYMQLET
jgi:hypothetical protein